MTSTLHRLSTDGDSFFADRLRHLCVLNCESQEDAARRVGVSVRQYSRWLGGSPPRASSVRKVASAYEVDPVWLLGRDGAPSPAARTVEEWQLDLVEAKLDQILALLQKRPWWRRG